MIFRNAGEIAIGINELLRERVSIEQNMRIEPDPVLAKLCAELLVSIEFRLGELFREEAGPRVLDAGKCRICGCSPDLRCGKACYLVARDLCDTCQRMMYAHLIQDPRRQASDGR
jgi:hypothetical protein